MPTIVPQFLVGGVPVPLTAFHTTLGTYGSVGHCDVTTSRSLLRAANVDLVAISAAAPQSLEVGLSVILDGVPVKLFGGEYVSARWDIPSDTIDIHCRDFAGLLVDQKRVLSTVARSAATALAPGQNENRSSISNQNQPLGDLVTAIAKMFNMTPILHLSGGNNPTVGSILGSSDTVFMPTPRSLWGILNRLARETGYEVHTTPQRELVFGTPGAGLVPLNLCWNVPTPPPGFLPIRPPFNVLHNPRRNLSFRVLVLSYDPAKSQTTRGEAYVVGTNVSTGGSSKIKAGAWQGADAATITNSLSANQGRLQIPLYTIRVDGLTQDQAVTKANAIAADIAKRELIVNATLDLVPAIVPLQPFNLFGDVEPEFAGHKYFINGASHVYRMPDSGSGDGMVGTRITGLDVQVQGAGDPLTTGNA